MKIGTVTRAFRERFSVKIFLLFSLLMLLLSSAFSGFFIKHQSSSLTDKLVKEGELLAGLLAHNARLAVFSESEQLLKDPVDAILQREGVQSVFIFTNEGRLLAKAFKEPGYAVEAVAEMKTHNFRGLSGDLAKSGVPLYFEGDRTFEFWAPVTVAPGYLSEDSLYFSEEPVTAKGRIIGFVGVTLDKSGLQRAFRGLLTTSFAIAFAFLMAGMVAIYFILRRVTRPLHRLTLGVHEIGKGESAEAVPVETADEIGKLAMAFNTMTESLKAREAEKVTLEELLRHAQKMEAVGTLSGGVAHDFNNILSAIIGYASLLDMDMDENNRLKHYVSQILASAERATHLTQGLLAFSRKQVINPKPVDLNDIVKRVDKLLLRLIGEDIDMKTVLSGKELVILADSGQIDQILINLAANARDAMPDGGSLTIETAHVQITDTLAKAYGHGEPGPYALLSVRDTGHGMTETVRDRIFEPFFTTKEVGKGTGLGLSIVYGIVKQHGGYITVESTPDRGTAFNLYFPLLSTRAEQSVTAAAVPIRGGTETVLVAEDEADVRKLTRSVLEGFGYKVIEAVDGEEAVKKFLNANGNIQLLLFDVVMPKKNGKEAYDQIRQIRPDVKVLFMSGYTAEVISRKGGVSEDLRLLHKPVSPKELLKRVRETLDA